MTAIQGTPSPRVLALGGAAGAVAAGSVAALAGPIVLMPLAGLVGTFVLIRLPGVLLAAYLLIPFYKGFLQEFIPVDLTVALAFANCLSLLTGVALREPLRIDALGLSLWVALGALMAVGVMYSPDGPLAVETLVQWLALVAVPLLAVLRVGGSMQATRQFLWTLFAFGCVMVVVGLLALAPGQRLVVLGTNTIGVARASLIVPITAFGFVLHSRRTGLRSTALVMVPLSLLVALASGSRGPVVALLVVGLVAGVMRLRSGGASLRIAAPVMAVGLAAAGGLLFIDLPTASLARYDLLVASLSGEGSDAYLDASLESRLSLYQLALSRFADGPFFGHGTAAFEATGGTFEYPHNLLLQFAADFGILGLGLILGIVGVASLRSPGQSHEWAAIRGLMFFFLINAMISGDAYAERSVWAFLLLSLLMPAADAAARRANGDPVPIAASRDSLASRSSRPRSA